MNVRPRISPSTAIAVAALVISLSGTALAASKLVNGDSLIKKSSLSGNRLRNHTLTAKQINLSRLGAVPLAERANTAATAGTAQSAATASHATSADALTTLPSGQSESGVFAGSGDGSSSGFYAFAITYPRPLASPISDDNIIDTASAPDPTHCPGPGKAAPGYLCLYSHLHSQTLIYGYSSDAPYSSLPASYGVALYGEIVGTSAYADGVWTVTAP